MARNHPNWLRAYLEYASYSEAPARFHYWSGVSTIAGALRRRVWIDQKYFQWTPNMYIIFVAPPGIISKSTTANIGMRLLRQVPGPRFGPNAITWQKLVSSLAEATEGVPDPSTGEIHTMSCITIASSEFGTLLNPADREMVDAIVDLWDGQIGKWSKSTKTQGDDEVEQPWVNLIACTTPAWIADNFPDYMIGGGFASRCVFLYGEEKDKLIAYPSEAVPTGHAALEASLVEDLTEISQLIGQYELTPDARQYGIDWYTQHYNECQTIADNRAIGYRARKQTHVHKLAMVIAAAKRSDLRIEIEDLQEAVQAVTDLESEMPKVFSLIGRTEGAKHTMAVREIVAKEQEIERRQLIRRLSNLYSLREISEGIEACLQAEYILQAQIGLGMMYVWNPRLAPTAPGIELPAAEEPKEDPTCTYPLNS